MEQAATNESLYKIAIGTLCAVILFLVGVLGKVAKVAWDSAMARVQDQKEIEKSVKSKKEEHS